MMREYSCSGNAYTSCASWIRRARSGPQALHEVEPAFPELRRFEG